MPASSTRYLAETLSDPADRHAANPKQREPKKVREVE
jgi:hypothetical protein